MKQLPILSILIATLWLLSGCSYRSYNVKHTSELHTTLEQVGVPRKVILQEVREEVIERIPIGSTEQEIREFCKAHFTKGLRNQHSIPIMLIPEELRGLESLSVLIRKHVDIPVGSSTLEVIFFLDEDRHLKDVVVERDSTYL